MVCLSQEILYYIPDERNIFCDCPLHSSVVQCLNKQYSHYNLKHIPSNLTNITSTYTNEFFGCVIEVETKI